MKSIILLLICLLPVFGFATPLLQRADSLYALRHRDARGGIVASTPRALEIIASYKQAIHENGSSPQAWSGLLRSVFFASYFTDSLAADWKSISAEGVQLADSALKLYPKDPEVLTWAGWVWCRYAEIAGIVRVARKGAAGRIREIGETLVQTAPKHGGGAGYRILALVHAKAPRIPVILPWPDAALAEQHFTHSVEIAPHNSLALYSLGDHLVERGQIEKGVPILRQALQVPADPLTPLEERYFRSKVRRILEKVDNPES